MKVIFNADDYGLCKGVNLGIVESYENGLVKSATMMANMPGFDHAVSIAPKGLGIGVHLTLTAGQALGGVYKTITDINGNFLRRPQLEERANTNQIDLDEIKKEYTLQIEKIIKTGIKPTHFDGHHHTQNFSGIVDVFISLANEYNVPVRLDEKNCNVKTVAFVSTFYGEGATESHLEEILSNIKETTEIMCHPAYIDNFLMESSRYSSPRAVEMDVLTSKRMKDMVLEKGLENICFGDL